MYPSPAKLEKYAEACEGDASARPLIMCEYSHAMGNSCGGLAEYWETINKHGALRSALPLSSHRGHRGALAGQGGVRSSHCLLGSGLLPDPTWNRVGLIHCSFAGSLGRGRRESYRRTAEILVAACSARRRGRTSM